MRGVLSAGVHSVPATRVGREAPPHPDRRLRALRRLAVVVVNEAMAAAPLGRPGPGVVLARHHVGHGARGYEPGGTVLRELRFGDLPDS